MMSVMPEKSNTKMYVKPTTQLENIQDDLLRFSRLITQLSGLEDDGLAARRLSDQIEAIHISIRSFETRCQAIHINVDEENFSVIENEDLFEPVITVNKDWKTLRKEARRAKKLTRQLTGSLRKVHVYLDENRYLRPFPNELLQINQDVENTMSGLVSEWNPNLY
jgi:hypothetical protein